MSLHRVWAGKDIKTGESIIFASRNDDQHQSGGPHYKKAMGDWNESLQQVYDRTPRHDIIITMRDWNESLQQVYDRTPRHDIIITMGDWNESLQQVYDRTPRHDIIITMRDWNESLQQVYDRTPRHDIITMGDWNESLQQVYDRTPRHDIIITMGDWNVKLGNQMEGENGVGGKHGLGSDRSDNGERFIEFCATNDMAIATTMFPHKDIHNYTWTSPDGRIRNQIDRIAVDGIFRRSVQDVRAFKGADVGSDHNLVVGNIRLKLSGMVRNHGERTARKYELSKLKLTEIKQRFVFELKNRFSCLAETEQHETGNDDTQNVESVEKNGRTSRKPTAKQ